MKKVLGWVVGALVALALVLFGTFSCTAAMVNDTVDETEEDSSPSGPVQVPEESPEDVYVPELDEYAGMEGSSDLYDFEINEVYEDTDGTLQDSSGIEYEAPGEGKFVIVDFDVTNHTDEPQYFGGEGNELTDAYGKSYGSDAEAELMVVDNPYPDLNPDQTANTRAIFFVNNDVEPTTIALGDMFGAAVFAPGG